MMNNYKNITSYRNFWKRVSDLVISLAGLVVLFPIFILVTVLLFFAHKSTPFFLQQRPGKGGRIFWLIKFRTMNGKKDVSGNLLPDELRITRLGRFIRSASLDEIPQLINVLKGDMSLIGPRPLLVQYLPLYTPSQSRRHNVKPGITGWAQVNGRNAIGWEQKFELDTWYVDNLGWQLDGRIVWLTAKKVIRSEDISQQGFATMPYFKGTGNTNYTP